MVIDRVFGLSGTSLSLNDRFTMLSASEVVNIVKKKTVQATQIRHAPGLSGHLYSDAVVPSIRQRLRPRANINALRQQAWQYNLIRRALLRGNLAQSNVRNRLGKRGATRGVRYRWTRINGVQAQRLQFARRSRPFNQRGRGRPRGQGVAQTYQQNSFRQTARRSRPFARGGRGRGRGRGRGGMNRQSQQLPSREQLDQELDQYMSCTKTALDKELDDYMQDALMDSIVSE